nr:hypothetical protein [uncultured Desulfobulbus sp.]
MIGLMYLLFFSAYALISLAVVVGAVKWARKRGRSTFRWGFAAAFIMYNLVFWDWIPSIIQHEYYCRTKAGFWVYKTLDQWKAENPGVLETLVFDKKGLRVSHEGDDWNYINHSRLNDRFEIVSHANYVNFLGVNFGVRTGKHFLVDLSNDDILSEYSGYSISSGSGKIRFWKKRICRKNRVNESDFWKYENDFRGTIDGPK